VIVQWNVDQFLVVEGVSGSKAYLNDPGMGPREYPQGVQRQFQRVVTAFKKGTTFTRGGAEPGLAPSWAPPEGLSGHDCFIAWISLMLVLPVDRAGDDRRVRRQYLIRQSGLARPDARRAWRNGSDKHRLALVEGVSCSPGLRLALSSRRSLLARPQPSIAFFTQRLRVIREPVERTTGLPAARARFGNTAVVA